MWISLLHATDCVRVAPSRMQACSHGMSQNESGLPALHFSCSLRLQLSVPRQVIPCMVLQQVQLKVVECPIQRTR